MDVADPFAPPYSNGHDTNLDHWSPAPEVDAPTANSGFGTDVADGGVDEAKRLATQLVETVGELARALTSADSERSELQRERQELRARIQHLEQAAARKEEFRHVFLQGAGADVTADDLKSLESVTTSLTSDPDRLTTVFAVVQRAEKLATIVRAYTELRSMVDEG